MWNKKQNCLRPILDIHRNSEFNSMSLWRYGNEENIPSILFCLFVLFFNDLYYVFTLNSELQKKREIKIGIIHLLIHP